MILRYFARILLIILGVASGICAAELGSITIPKDAYCAGTSLPSGVYTLEIDETSEQPYVQFTKNGKVAARDKAIILPAKGAGKTSVQLTKFGRKEFIRIRARFRDKWYFAYLETSQ